MAEASENKSIAEPLYQVKLLSALRSGDSASIHQLLTEIGKDKRKSTDGDHDVDIGAAALHLAIRCASCETVRLLLSHRSISPNAVYPRGSGTTALHLAASLGRADVLSLLLEQDEIDDTLRDAQGRSCRDVARGKDVLKAIRDSRSLFTASYRSLLHSYTSSPPNAGAPQAILDILHSPRARLLDLSYLDPTTGRSLLHEAARRKDLSLIDLAVRAGADVFVRDRRGKAVGEGGSKDDKVRVFLRQFTNQDTSLLEQSGSSSSESQMLRGYLSKYANVAKGYNTRWFVLKNGILSYYRHQDDENVASRGSIAMRSAILKIHPSEKLHFEVHSAGRGSGQQKWYIRGSHEVEVRRWIRALERSIEHARRDSTGGPSPSGSQTGHGSTQNLSASQTMVQSQSGSDLDRSSLRSVGASSPGNVGGKLKVRAKLKAKTPFAKRLNAPDTANPDAGPSKSSDSSLDEVVPDDRVESGSIKDVLDPDEDDSMLVGHAAVQEQLSAEDDDEEEEKADESSDAHSERGNIPPHEESFILNGNAAVAQAELTAQLASSLISISPTLSTANATLDSERHARELRTALEESTRATARMISDHLQMAQARDTWWRARLEKERTRGALWEESLAGVVREGEELERELRSRLRGKSKVGTDTVRRRSSVNAVGLGIGGGLFASPTLPITLEQPTPGLPVTVSSSSSIPLAQATPEKAKTISIPSTSPVPVSPPPPPLAVGDAESTVDTDEEDEFFDAIESNLLPNVVVPDAFVHPGPPATAVMPQVDMDQYAGYTHLRDKLPIEKDTRPPTSLWSVLKHSIGKDLTKISFPVFFNEPTSMLQRMAEDMEFSECLDAAVAEPDPLRRIAFVAAFAMSNYSSTIGRIAKPFNPMLSETFEYVRLDKKYRYVSEQVSHHPPISACWAESLSWHYFGEVDAQNKFMGKSFEIRPTGVAHAELIIPEKFGGLDYPKATGPNAIGNVVEHYSWKKVTTNVSGFILGSPTIDHYGDMNVVNHRTGDTCILTFKPRGWRGKDAFEILGKVMDADGNIVYEIAGRWNSQLVARAIGTGLGALHPDVTVKEPTSPSQAEEFVLLWRNTEKPIAPFNLTPFAITLNDLPEATLKPVICPTDCRLRPDQRAFELGKYERANMLKQKQEEFQRATRKAREEGRKPRHHPRWFKAKVEPETGERFWEPLRTESGEVAYWKEREAVWKNSKSWSEIEKIFIDDQP